MSIITLRSTPHLKTIVWREQAKCIVHVLYLVVHLPLEHGAELVVCHQCFSVQRLKYHHVFALKEIRKRGENFNLCLSRGLKNSFINKFIRIAAIEVYN
jgi:hypothetical protein